MKRPIALLLLAGLGLTGIAQAVESVTVATVNNSDMVRMQRLS